MPGSRIVFSQTSTKQIGLHISNCLIFIEKCQALATAASKRQYFGHIICLLDVVTGSRAWNILSVSNDCLVFYRSLTAETSTIACRELTFFVFYRLYFACFRKTIADQIINIFFMSYIKRVYGTVNSRPAFYIGRQYELLISLSDDFQTFYRTD